MVTRFSVFIAAAVVLANVSPGSAEVLDKIFEGEALDKVCVPAPDMDVYQVDMDKLVCETLGQQVSCSADPGIIRKLRQPFIAKYRLQLIAFGQPQGSRFFESRALQGCPAEAPFSAEQILRSDCVQVICTSYTAPAIQNGTAAAEKAPAFPFGFVVRETPDQLGLQFKSAKPALFAFDRNFQDGGNKFAFTGLIGYPLSGYTRSVNDPELGEQLFNPYSIVPFAALQRTENTSPAGEDVTNISAGVSANYTITSSSLLGGTSHGFSLNGRVVTDEEVDSLIADGQLVYRPVPPFTIFTGGIDLGGISMRLDPSAIFDFGHVFDPGNKTELLTTNSYLRAGGGLGVVFFPSLDPAFDFLDGFTASVNYTHLYGFDGPVDEFHRFESSIGYAFPRDNYGIALRYLNGHIPVSLETEESLRLEFTVKF